MEKKFYTSPEFEIDKFKIIDFVATNFTSNGDGGVIGDSPSDDVAGVL